MIKFDLETYTKKFIDLDEYRKIYAEKDMWIKRLFSYDMIGWMKEIDTSTVQMIELTARNIKNNFDCMVVVGIGGSYLGSYAFHKMFQKYFQDTSFEVIYAGTTLSDNYLDELLQYLDKKNFCMNVISKSGNTMETSITYQLIKDLLKRKYSNEEIVNRIIITTDKEKGKLREEVNQYGYLSFEIPRDIGGRYSFISPAHLLPLALNYDIEKIIEGFYDGKRYIDLAFQYALIRNCLYKKKKVIENFCISEEKMTPFTEWLKQLFGETEGKNNRGIYPTYSVYSRDLHSMGQFIQEGSKIVFETFIKIEKSSYYINYNGRNLHDLNNTILDSVIRAHYSGDVPCLEITIEHLNIETISSLIYFFQLSAAFSALLMGVNPFNQPGVEIYKKEVKDSIGEL